MVLNCYRYTGRFSVAALAASATDVTSVDLSGPALKRTLRRVALNGFNAAHHTFICMTGLLPLSARRAAFRRSAYRPHAACGVVSGVTRVNATFLLMQPLAR